MLTILPQQMEAFSVLAQELLAQNVGDYLRKEYSETIVQLPSRRLPVSEIADDDLKRMVRTALARAASYGLSHESSLAGFVAIMFDAAPNFDQHPDLRPTLIDEAIPADDRVRRVLEQFTEAVWHDVKTNYDIAVWNAT